jgi:hypothetical protein
MSTRSTALSVAVPQNRTDLQVRLGNADDTRVTPTQLPRPHAVMVALANGCPLTLLIDLTDSRGPDSKRIMAREHADMSWLRGLGLAADIATVATAQETG